MDENKGKVYETTTIHGSKLRFLEDGCHTIVYVDDKEWGVPQGDHFIKALLRDIQQLNQALDYDNLLDEWNEKVMDKAEKYQKSSEVNLDEYFKTGKDGTKGSYKKGFAEGLIMATSMLSTVERRAMRKLKKGEKNNG
ncbi:MAG: hypothetical protein RSE41_07690 [Clostridia bacterium]